MGFFARPCGRRSRHGCQDWERSRCGPARGAVLRPSTGPRKTEPPGAHNSRSQDRPPRPLLSSPRRRRQASRVPRTRRLEFQ